MTVSELYRAVSLLGFEDGLESAAGFCFAANRAIMQVNKIRPRTAEYEIFRHNIKNLVRSSFIPTIYEKDIIYEAQDAKAFYFEANGHGMAFIERFDGKAWEILGSREIKTSAFEPFRGFIQADGAFVSGRVRLRFTAHPDGAFVYFIKNAALYGRVYTPNEKDIPAYERYTVYDMATLCGDFLAFCSPPIREEGYERLSTGYDIDGASRLVLPYEAQGIYKILYERKPAAIADTGEPESDETQIDLDEELCSLLPNLVASYVWADDEPEKAQYYMSLYRERAAEIAEKEENFAPVKITNVSGW